LAFQRLIGFLLSLVQKLFVFFAGLTIRNSVPPAVLVKLLKNCLQKTIHFGNPRKAADNKENFLKN